MSTIKVNNIQSRTGSAISFTSGDTITIPSGATLTNNGTANGFPGLGKIGQVVSTTKTDVFSLGTGGTVFTDITGLSASITPSSTSSKIYIMSNVTLGMSTNSILMTRLVRGTTSICIGDASGSRSRASSGAYPEGGNAPVFNSISNFLDSPSTTSATTYKVQLATENATAYVNRNGRNDNLARDATYTSTITLMEVLA